MKITNIFITAVLIMALATPSMAASNWVDDFLRRYQPSAGSPEAAVPDPGQNLAQLLQTGTMPLMLNDVVNLMLENNLSFRANRLSPTSAYWQSLVFWKALQPSFGISGTVGRNTALSTTQLNGATAQTNLTGAYAATFSQLLPTGTSLLVAATMNRSSTNSNNSIFNPSYTGRLTYTVGQHLLQNRGQLANTYLILEGLNTEKISEAQLETQLTALIVQASKAYWNLVFAMQDLNVKQKALDLNQRLLDENKLMIDIGTLAKIDIVQTETAVANSRDQLVTSTSNVTIAEDQIKTLISSDKDPAMFLMKVRPEEAPRSPEGVEIPTLEEAVRVALENRPEIRQAMLNLKNRGIDVQFKHNQKLPILDVTASYTQNGTGGEKRRDFTLGSQPLANPIPGGLSNAFGQLFSYQYSGYALGFNLVIPIKNKAAEADYVRAENEQRLAQTQLDGTLQQIALDVRNSLTQVETSRSRIDTTKLARELAQMTADAEQEKFELGTSTVRFVLQDQQNLATAQSAELQAIVNFTNSLIDLDRAMGLTLKRNNIELEKLVNPTIAGNSGVAIGHN